MLRTSFEPLIVSTVIVRIIDESRRDDKRV